MIVLQVIFGIVMLFGLYEMLIGGFKRDGFKKHLGKTGRTLLWTGGITFLIAGTQLTGFSDSAGTAVVIFGVVLLVIAFFASRAAKKSAAPPQA